MGGPSRRPLSWKFKMSEVSLLLHQVSLGSAPAQAERAAGPGGKQLGGSQGPGAWGSAQGFTPAPPRLRGPWTRGRGRRAAGPLWRWGRRLCVRPRPAGRPPSAKITPAAAPYLALCHQLPKNSENQIYFPISAARPLCSELSLTVVTAADNVKAFMAQRKASAGPPWPPPSARSSDFPAAVGTRQGSSSLNKNR